MKVPYNARFLARVRSGAADFTPKGRRFFMKKAGKSKLGWQHRIPGMLGEWPSARGKAYFRSPREIWRGDKKGADLYLQMRKSRWERIKKGLKE